jgi:hypothetical protein
MRRTLLTTVLLSPLVAVAPALAWPTLTESPTAIHIELPAIQLPPLDAPSIHYHLQPQALHFPPVDVNLPKGLEAVKTPAELVEKVLYNVFPQFGPWSVCTLAGSANDADMTKAQSESCEAAVYAQTKAMGVAMIAAARQAASQIDEGAAKTKGAQDARSMNEPAVEGVCVAASYAGCEKLVPEACKSVIGATKPTWNSRFPAAHELSPAGRQAACENEVVAGCATLVEAVCESTGHVVASLKTATKGGAK